MAKRSVRDIVAEMMPDMEIIEATGTAIADSAKTTRPGHSLEDLRKKYLQNSVRAEDANPAGTAIEELRKKYLGTDAASSEQDSGVAEAAADEGDDAGDIEVVQVRPKASSVDANVPATPKTLIVSKTRGIIGRQG